MVLYGILQNFIMFQNLYIVLYVISSLNITPPSGYFCRCSFRGWWQIFFLMWTWGAPLATCILDIYSLKSIRYLFNKIQLLKKSFNNIKDQCQNMNFNTPIDTSAVIYYYLNLWSQKISFKNLFKLFKPNMLEYMCLLYY